MALLKTKTDWLFFAIAMFISAAGSLHAQTTGKIAGRVTDKKTGDSLPGANVLIDGTTRGAVTDLNGDFYIINVAPGTYMLRVTLIGYEPVRVEGLRVSVNRTSDLEVKMAQTAVELGEEVVVTAKKIAIKKDQT
ncbi:MAG: carboxypeptidase-like regulatory domain-containing protein, partial [bacterium]